MHNITEILDKAFDDVVDHLGLKIWVNGKQYSVTVFDGEVERQGGIRTELLLDFKNEDTIFLKKDDIAIFKDIKYKIGRISKENQLNPFRTVELLRA